MGLEVCLKILLIFLVSNLPTHLAPFKKLLMQKKRVRGAQSSLTESSSKCLGDIQQLSKPNCTQLLPHTSFMRVGSDTFGDPIFQKGLQN